MDDALQERIEALERTVADGEFDTELADHTQIEQRLSAVESQLEAIDDQIDDLEAATQALRGYVGNIRSVNDEVEQRANSALAKAEALEATFDGSTQCQPTESPTDETTTQSTDSASTSEWSRSTPTDEQSVAGDGVPTPGSRQSATPHETTTKQDANECCHACGRTRQTTESDATTPPGATDGGAVSETTNADSGQRTDDPLVPEESEETGTLRRIRELL
jgi:hypothetical protein